MNIVDFQPCHAAEAALIAKKQLEKECAYVKMPQSCIAELTGLVDAMGVAAIENGRMVGYLCAFGPFRGMFGTYGTPFAEKFVGVFSPVEAHGVAEDAPPRTWQRMYQAAAEKWAKAGALYHAISLYEHDATAKAALFRYGFGQRCADAIRQVEPLHAEMITGVTCRELPAGSGDAVRALRECLDKHLCESPCFMVRTEEGRREWLDTVKHRQSRLFVAETEGRPIAFIEVNADGENFVTEHPDMLNICGAYCEPAWRGQGVSKALLDHILCKLQAEGVQYLGVDYETMNPTAVGFWEKYFVPYTASLVRRIDG